jgi:hypothetical protein
LIFVKIVENLKSLSFPPNKRVTIPISHINKITNPISSLLLMPKKKLF